MKLERFNRALEVAEEFGLDGTDIAILFAITQKRRNESVATIMQFSAGMPFASFATIHERVKRMVRKGVLSKEVKEENQRVKVLQDGPALSRFLDRLDEV
jgi:hypothetical protein